MLTDPRDDYARGFVPFLGSTIYLDSHPLIPRSETEWWVEKAIAKIQESRIKSPKVLDLFAGSGCIGIAVLTHVPGTVDFGELESQHFPTIEKSLRENGIDAGRVHIVSTDVFSNISDRYDYILANPPYVAHETVVDQSVTDYEPHEALFADNGGFALIAATIQGAQDHLYPGGRLWIEHDPAHAPRIAATAQQSGLSTETYPDQYGTLRYSVVY